MNFSPLFAFFTNKYYRRIPKFEILNFQHIVVGEEHQQRQKNNQ